MRGIDHLVLAVADLEAARQRYGDLGFTLTPPGRHPFGTANSLVQLDGAFLELLSIAEPAAIPPHAPGRFSFAAFNRDYLDAGDGFSMLVLDSRDARADAEAFRRAGLVTYEPFDFSRTAELPSGEEAKVGFSLAFTGHPDIDSAAFFTCQQHAPEHFWRPEYQNHENTAHTVQEVCLVADRPLQFAEFLQAFAGSDEVAASDSAVEVATARGHLIVLTGDAFAERYGTSRRRRTACRRWQAIPSASRTFPSPGQSWRAPAWPRRRARGGSASCRKMPSGRSWRSPGPEAVGTTGQVVIYSPGLWRLRHEVAALSGLAPVRGARWRALPADATVAGWGHKPTADYAMAVAAKHKAPYLAIEDGWLRSVRPGSAEPPSSLVLDRSGIYYDARGPSDLETMLESAEAPTSAEQADAEAAIDLLRRNRLSKYNEAPPEDDISEIGRSAAGTVLVADQTFGDASIAGGLADAESFRRMVEAAVAENPGARIIVKLHPEVTSGRKRGYLATLALPEGCTVLSRRVNPWALLERVDKVYTVSSQLGFEALMAGRQVICFGMPFYAGWGLTDDRVSCPRRTTRVSLARLVHAAFFGYCRYLDAWRRHETDFFTAADQLLFLRQRYLANSRPVTGYRITAWKRRAVRAFLDGPGPVSFTRNLETAIAKARAQDGAVAAWGTAAGRIAGEVRGAGVDLMTIEDGFLRSVGLGASFTPALSYVFDSSGIYYDPSRPSDLEAILQSTHSMPPSSSGQGR
jgi:catechol 2,3-dioxygenase-like lactoylglutathione lyase family enzyme